MADENENDDDDNDEYLPPFMYDEHTKDDYLHVVVVIKGLKVSREVKMDGFLPKIRKKPTNATIRVEFGNWSFKVNVKGESGDLKWGEWRLNLKELPYEIIADESYFEFMKNEIHLYLRKLVDRSWDSAIKSGLDIAWKRRRQAQRLAREMEEEEEEEEESEEDEKRIEHLTLNDGGEDEDDDDDDDDEEDDDDDDDDEEDDNEEDDDDDDDKFIERDSGEEVEEDADEQKEEERVGDPDEEQHSQGDDYDPNTIIEERNALFETSDDWFNSSDD